jgi:TonB family protein
MRLRIALAGPAVLLLALACAKSKPVEMYRYHPAHPHVTEQPPPYGQPHDFRYRIHEAEDPFSQSFETHPDVAAVRISGADPELTAEARKAKVKGVVMLRIGIDENGRPAGYYLVKPLPYGLTEAAINAVRKWRFKPALSGGRPIRSTQLVTLRFGL